MTRYDGIRRNSGLTYALKYASFVLRKGIGISKREVYKQNGGVSPYIHSWSTFKRYMGIAKDFVKWAKDRGINRLDKVEYGHVKEYLLEKAEKGCSKKTLKLNMSALEKFFEAVGRKDISESLRRDYTEIYSKGRYNGRALPFDKPREVISKIKQTEYRVMAELQYLIGARLGDLKKIRIDDERKVVIIERSKGGKTREIDYRDRPEKFQRIKELKQKLDEYIKEKGWSKLRKEYPEAVRYVAKLLGEIYTGTHAFRVNYAQERYKELTGRGISESVALKIVTRELGHERTSMAKYYVDA